MLKRGNYPNAIDLDSADYDVVKSKGDWTSGDPFTLTGIGAHLYGRGVIDNKGELSHSNTRIRFAHVTCPLGPIIAVAVAAADLLERDELDLDVVLLLEGEEEVVRNTTIAVHGLAHSVWNAGQCRLPRSSGQTF